MPQAPSTLFLYPTESVYGVGCRPDDLPALRRLLRLKKRSWRKGLIVIAAHVWQLRPYVRGRIPNHVRQTWPGPNTWVLPASPRCSRLLRGQHKSLAVRVTAHPPAKRLCQRLGALVSTSANHAGKPPARSAKQARHLRLPIVKGRVGKLAQPTTIRDGKSGAVLRQG
jgi:L-threonylcarbamoyladenylate synthase